MRANQRLRAVLLLAILAFCCYGLADEWPRVQPWIGHLHVYSIAGSLAAAMASACPGGYFDAYVGCCST